MTPIFENIIALSEGQEATDFSYLWAGISSIAAQLARKVYLPFGNGNIYPNLYIMFLGEPGRRKSTAIKDMINRLEATGYSKFCRGKVTMQKYLMDLATAGDYDILSDNPLGYAENYIAQDEFSDFMGINNHDFISLLGNLWDIDKDYSYRVKNDSSVSISRPIINILGGITPGDFSTIFPASIAEHGFLSRLLIVNIQESLKKYSRQLPSCPKASAAVHDGLLAIRDVKGAAIMSDDVWKKLDDIYCNPIPINDARFSYYMARRYTQLLKLCIITMASRLSVEMTVEDVVFANTLLTFTEHYMPQALGQYGKNKDGDVASKILAYLSGSFPLPRSIPDILKHVSTETTLKDLPNILNNLTSTDKIVATNAGFVFKKSSYKDIISDNVDWNLLGSITKNKFL